MKYPKGDWQAIRNGMGWSVVTDHERICTVSRHFRAHLIAAAPIGDELATAILDSSFEDYDDWITMREIAKRFRAKVEGGN